MKTHNQGVTRRGLGALVFVPLAANGLSMRPPAPHLVSSSQDPKPQVLSDSTSQEFDKKIGCWAEICNRCDQLKDDYQHYLSLQADLQRLRTYSTKNWAGPNSDLSLCVQAVGRDKPALESARGEAHHIRNMADEIRNDVLNKERLPGDRHANYHQRTHEIVRVLDQEVLPAMAEAVEAPAIKMNGDFPLSQVLDQQFDPVERAYELILQSKGTQVRNGRGDKAAFYDVFLKLELEIDPSELVPSGASVVSDLGGKKVEVDYTNHNNDRRSAQSMKFIYNGRLRCQAVGESDGHQPPSLRECATPIQKPAPLEDLWHWYHLSLPGKVDRTNIPDGVLNVLAQLSGGELKVKLASVEESISHVQMATESTKELIRLGEMYLNYVTHLRVLLSDNDSRLRMIEMFASGPMCDEHRLKLWRTAQKIRQKL